MAKRRRGTPSTYSEISGAWNISGKSLDRGNPLVTNTYGTLRVNGYKLLEDALNLRDTKIYDTIHDADGDHRVLNKQETMLAQQAQESIREAFKQWIFKDLDRREDLCATYNRIFNAIRPREYDGRHIRFEGMTPEISLMPHQKNAVAHILYGKTAFYYVNKESLVKFNGFLAPKAEGSYLILNEGGYQIEGQTDTWKVIDEKNVQEQRFVQLVCEQTKKQKPDIVLHDSGVLVAQTIYGFDSSVMKKIEKFLREQKPELLHHQKFLENGTAERAKESGTEQNYNMIDGCVNNNPKKPRIIGNRISVLDRLHIKLEERKQKSQPQQQQERSRKN